MRRQNRRFIRKTRAPAAAQAAHLRSVATRHAGLLTAFSGRTSGQSNGERGSQAALVEQIQPGVVMHTPDVFMVGHKPQILKQHRPRDDVRKSTLAGVPIVAAGEDDAMQSGGPSRASECDGTSTTLSHLPRRHRCVGQPTYTELVGAAQAFVASQPPPYNTGTCF
jgi:hypothetical protein